MDIKNWKDNIGKTVYIIINNQIKKDFIIAGKEHSYLNCGDPDVQDRLLPSDYEYKLDKANVWLSSERIYFGEDDILEKFKKL